jgi:hypothetical protein
MVSTFDTAPLTRTASNYQLPILAAPKNSMKSQRLLESYFEKFSNDPIQLKPFDPESKRRAMAYGEKLDILLARFSLHAKLFGSKLPSCPFLYP